ncbi:MAG: branched-chain amino acid ABC transporter permease, partial [Rhodospirillales bacterium]|nr:branched-chain amino acid ABC transporter permease [Rhodospirillales bacterium]
MTVDALVYQGLIGVSLAMYLWLLAAGLTIAFGVLGVVNFAHGSLYMLGGYFAFTYYLTLEMN